MLDRSEEKGAKIHVLNVHIYYYCRFCFVYFDVLYFYVFPGCIHLELSIKLSLEQSIIYFDVFSDRIVLKL